jgi:hypothetical protein
MDHRVKPDGDGFLRHEMVPVEAMTMHIGQALEISPATC